ncbi:signal peptidase I [Virgibacillus chiguensis]|uniref:Signal peptidase I n=1 Tax=Virgibacillus chiguensis TaxID=411959 RepID=A0A1M5NA02_9BACI|nr:signal peptidase I [Virgibacillus chiguensis]SHG86327.1 signal peptidase I [Virgibacillus chiguensis]
MTEKSNRKKYREEWLGWGKTILIALGLAFIIRTFLFAPIVVEGPSMLPTLHNGDQMMVNKIIYDLKDPKRFDIVVFHASSEKDFIKRVIGLPGDHVEVRNNILYINGKEIEQNFLNGQANKTQAKVYTNNFTLEDLPGSYRKIPEDYVLVLGDNRENSMDSRSLGLIPMDQIVGKTNFIYWPFERMQLIGK